jgi:hypothetical protein
LVSDGAQLLFAAAVRFEEFIAVNSGLPTRGAKRGTLNPAMIWDC